MQNIFSRYGITIHLVKKVVFLCMVFCASVAIELFVFGGILCPIEKSVSGIFPVYDYEEPFDSLRTNNSSFVSKEFDETITLKTDGKYVYDLRLEISKNISFPITVSYVDPKTNAEVTVTNEMQKFMAKKEVEFGNFLIYHIGSAPEQLVIHIERPGTEIAKIAIDNEIPFNFFRLLWIFGILVLAIFFIVYRKLIARKPEFGFLAVALTCGSVLSLAGPSYTYTWDEKIHYQHAEKIAYHITGIEFRPGSVPFSYSLKEKKEVDAYVESQYKRPKKSPNNGKFFYTQLGYSPSIAALVVGEIFPLPHTLVFAFGRWFNVFVFSCVVFFALRKLRSGKMILATVALLPTSLFLASNYDYDWWVTSFLMLGMAYLFSELQQPEKKISCKDVGIMLGAFVLGLGPKAIYAPLMLLLFLLPKKKFKNQKQYKVFLWATAVSLVLVLASFFGPFLVQGPGEGDHRGGSEVNATEQVHFILSEPLAYTDRLLHFLGQYMNPQNALGYTTFFAYLGPIDGMLFVLILLLLVTIFDKNRFDSTLPIWKLRVGVVGICFGITALIATALYVSFTPVRSEGFSGVQARYLLPLLFPFLFVVGSAKIRKVWSIRCVKRSIFEMFIFLSLASVFLWGVWENIIQKYY